jgi:hypothetical protein
LGSVTVKQVVQRGPCPSTKRAFNLRLAPAWYRVEQFAFPFSVIRTMHTRPSAGSEKSCTESLNWAVGPGG